MTVVGVGPLRKSNINATRRAEYAPCNDKNKC